MAMSESATATAVAACSCPMPSTSRITSVGSIWATSANRSTSVRPVTTSSWRSTDAVTEERSRSAPRPVKIVLTRRRSRVCTSPSVVSTIRPITEDAKPSWCERGVDALVALTLHAGSPRMMAVARS